MGKDLIYKDGETELTGYFAAPAAGGKAPGVLVAPSWTGLDENLKKVADRLAAAGFAALALDVFGPEGTPEKMGGGMEAIMPFLQDRIYYRKRLKAGLEAIRQQPECDPARVGGIGYCFGGAGMLEMARAGMDVKGVVSFHGVFDTPMRAEPGAVKAQVLVLHGDADSLIQPDQVARLREELNAAGADWEIVIYSGAVHGFSGEGSSGGEAEADSANTRAAARSWVRAIDFLNETL